MINQLFGEIRLPEPLAQGYGQVDTVGGGLLGFFNNILKLVTVVAGLFAMVNFILAGYGILSSGGDPEKVSKSSEKIWYSMLGMVLIVAAYAFAALLGWILFKDSTAILNPKIYGPGT
jgi:hypothetical protein